MEKVDINKVALFSSGLVIGSGLLYMAHKIQESSSSKSEQTTLIVPEENKKESMTIQEDQQFYSLSTRAIHSGWDPYKDPHGVMVPGIDLSTTYAQNSPAEPLGPFDYIRCGNPTRQALEDTLCDGIYPREGEHDDGRYSMLFSSYTAAANCLFQLLGKSDVLLVPKNFWTQHAHPGIEKLLTFLQQNQQFAVQEVDMNDKTSLANLLNEGRNTVKMIYVPALGFYSNEAANINQLRQIIISQRQKFIILVCDNSLLTGASKNPLPEADVVLDDLTAMDGIGDVRAGSLVTNSRFLYDKLFFINKSVGDNPPPLDIYFIHRGFKTLSVRRSKQISNAQKVESFIKAKLGQCPKLSGVTRAYNVLMLEVKSKLKDFKMIGAGADGIRSVAVMQDNNLRLWVGCEDVEYVIADLFQASS